MGELKKCPFCGGEAAWDFLNGYKTMGWSIVCIQCRSRCGYHATKEEAIIAWNTRKPMERIVERLDEEKKQARKGCESPISTLDRIAHVNMHNTYMKAIAIVKEESCLTPDGK